MGKGGARWDLYLTVQPAGRREAGNGLILLSAVDMTLTPQVLIFFVFFLVQLMMCDVRDTSVDALFFLWSYCLLVWLVPLGCLFGGKKAGCQLAKIARNHWNPYFKAPVSHRGQGMWQRWASYSQTAVWRINYPCKYKCWSLMIMQSALPKIKSALVTCSSCFNKLLFQVIMDLINFRRQRNRTGTSG